MEAVAPIEAETEHSRLRVHYLTLMPYRVNPRPAVWDHFSRRPAVAGARAAPQVPVLARGNPQLPADRLKTCLTIRNSGGRGLFALNAPGYVLEGSGRAGHQHSQRGQAFMVGENGFNAFQRTSGKNRAVQRGNRSR